VAFSSSHSTPTFGYVQQPKLRKRWAAGSYHFWISDHNRPIWISGFQLHEPLVYMTEQAYR